MPPKMTQKEKAEYKQLVNERVKAKEGLRLQTVLLNEFTYGYKSTIYILFNLML